ncbi:MAG: flagellar M-ring protein FliF, partial [Acidimicrobiaceae bacterium]|nr:flagellar M-ring protein FliF [Acidimicrobiaceae bacterium]
LADVNQERITLAEAGLPAGGNITFQTLASTGITSSQFVQSVDYQQALEGQLQQTIESIQGVQGAQVSLVMPDTTTFAVGNTQQPSASVLVNLGTGTTLSSEQVQAIVHLVASAVPDLSAQQVTVADNLGDVLSAPGVDVSSGQDQAMTNSYDANLAAQVTALLARILGPNNAAVQAHAVLNFNDQKTVTNGIATNGKGQPIIAPTSQSTTRDIYQGTNPQSSGILGSGQPATVNSGNGNYNQTQTQTQNAISQVTQTVQQAPGQVVRTALAVVVNSRARGARNLAQIRALVAAAAGLQTGRGDSLVVSSLPFTATPVLTTPKASLRSRLLADAPALGLVLLILLLLFFALRSAKKRAPRFEEIPLTALPAMTAAPNFDISSFDTGELPAVRVPEYAALAPASAPMPSDVDTYIQNNPDEVAQLMRMWARERAGAHSGPGSGT